MPERMAKTDPMKQVTEWIGSGPYRFLHDEWVPGAQVAWAKFDGYVPRKEPVSGIAGGRVTDTILVSNPATTAFANLVDSTSRSGYVLGGGLEYAFDRHWSLKAEYQYLNLGSGILSGPIVNPAPGVSITSTTVKDNFQTVRSGVNFRF